MELFSWNDNKKKVGKNHKFTFEDVENAGFTIREEINNAYITKEVDLKSLRYKNIEDFDTGDYKLIKNSVKINDKDSYITFCILRGGVVVKSYQSSDDVCGFFEEYFKNVGIDERKYFNYSYNLISDNTEDEIVPFLESTNKEIRHTHGLKRNKSTTFEKVISKEYAIMLATSVNNISVKEKDDFIDINTSPMR